MKLAKLGARGSGGTRWAAAVLAVTMLAASGCFWLVVGAAAGGSAAVYYQGRLQQSLGADVATCRKAAESTLADLKLPVLQSRADAVTGHLESEYSDGKHVWIDLESVGPNITKVTIRVGLMGDQARSVTILEGIKRHAGL